MWKNKIIKTRIFSLYAFSSLGSLLLAACGSSAVPDAPDASVVDAMPACQCPSAETLTADRIRRDIAETNTYTGLAHECELGETMLAGSCFVEPPSTEVAIFFSGFSEYSVPSFTGWICAWRNLSGEVRRWLIAVVCLEPDEGTTGPLLPNQCSSCPPSQPLEERVSRVAEAGRLAVDSVATFETSCDDQGVLIGGGCSLDLDGPEDGMTNMLEIGSPSPDTIQCTWNNPTQKEFVVTAAAMCVYPPLPGKAEEAVPISERIVRVTREVDLGETGLRMVDVTCDFGDTLIWGGCGVDNQDEPYEALRDLELFRAGFRDESENRPNTWQCGWDVPADLTTSAKGIATAICLRPVEAAMQM